MSPLITLIIAALFIASCSTSNKKLEQAGAENAIKAFISSHVPSGTPLETVLNVQSIVRVAPLSQFSENEASTTVKFKDIEKWKHPAAFKFHFRRTVDGKWFLVGLAYVGPPDGPDPGESGWENMLIEKNSNLNIPVPD